MTDDIIETERKVIIYSNVEINKTINGIIATIEPLDNFGSIPSYLLTYKNRMENNGSGIIAMGDHQIVEDLLASLSFWFQGIFSTNKDSIRGLTRQKKEDFLEKNLPTEIIPRIFNKQYISNEEKINGFSEFIQQLIGLTRVKYKQIIKTIRQYRDALYTINSNLELAYTMFVASVESLVQKFDNYESNWNDVDEILRIELEEKVFSSVTSNIANEIRMIITEFMHLKLSRRYTEFCLSNISKSFFMEQATEIDFPCRKSQLKDAIENSYKIRSKYVHALKEIPKIISLGGGHEVFNDDGDLYFTFSGISRFVRDVILSFINKQNCIESESIDYMDELPNVIHLKRPVSSWIHNAELYTVKNALDFFNALLEEILSILTGQKKSLVNLSEVCDEIIKLIKGVSESQKVPMAAFYLLYNFVLKAEDRHPQFDEFLESNSEVSDILAMENIIIHLLTKNDFPWDIEEIYDYYKDYDKKRYRKNKEKIPQKFEVCLLIELANLSLQGDKNYLYKEIMQKALYENPGNSKLISAVNNLDYNLENRVIIDWEKEILLAN